LRIKTNSTPHAGAAWQAAADIWKKSRLNWKLKISNATYNADITQRQARDTRDRRIQEVNTDEEIQLAKRWLALSAFLIQNSVTIFVERINKLTQTPNAEHVTIWSNEEQVRTEIKRLGGERHLMCGRAEYRFTTAVCDRNVLSIDEHLIPKFRIL